MTWRINYLGFLSLLALLAVLGFLTDNKGFYGFLGFLAYLRYFWVKPDELFLLNVQRSATAAFLLEMVALVPLIFYFVLSSNYANGLAAAFGGSFIVAVVVFSLLLTFLEFKEMNGAAND